MSVFATLHGWFSRHCVCSAACTDSRPDCACRYVRSVPSVGDASCHGIAAPVCGKCNILSIFIGEQPPNRLCSPAISRSCRLGNYAQPRIAARATGEGNGPLRGHRTLAKRGLRVDDVPNASHPFQSDIKAVIKAFPFRRVESPHDPLSPVAVRPAGAVPGCLQHHPARAAQPARHLGTVAEPQRARAGRDRPAPHRSAFRAAEPGHAAQRQQRRQGQLALSGRRRWPHLPAGRR